MKTEKNTNEAKSQAESSSNDLLDSPTRDPKSTMSFSEAVQMFKASEDIESVLCLTGKKDADQRMRRVALAFPKTPLQKCQKKNKFTDGPDLWNELWDGVIVDHEALEIACGFRVWLMLSQLRANRIVFPDGTLGVAAQKALRQLAKNELGL